MAHMTEAQCFVDSTLGKYFLPRTFDMDCSLFLRLSRKAVTIPIASYYQYPHPWSIPVVHVRDRPYVVPFRHTGSWKQPTHSYPSHMLRPDSTQNARSIDCLWQGVLWAGLTDLEVPSFVRSLCNARGRTGVTQTPYTMYCRYQCLELTSCSVTRSTISPMPPLSLSILPFSPDEFHVMHSFA